MSDEIVKADFDACDALLRQGEGRGDYISANIDHIDSWKEAAESGNQFGQVMYGYCFEGGRGVEKDVVFAADLFAKAANQGNLHAQFLYGQEHYVNEDDEQAARWLEKPADEGYFPAQHLLGEIYLASEDHDQATRWFQLAADQGYPDSMWQLGWLAYERYMAADSDEKAEEYLEESLKFLHRAADNAVVNAQYYLALHYAEFEDRHDEARDWFKSAMLLDPDYMNERIFTWNDCKKAFFGIDPIRHIDTEVASAFVASDGEMDLTQCISIDDEAAEILGDAQCDLMLQGLTSISDAAIESLTQKGVLNDGRCRYQLSLGNVPISLNAAKSLSKYQGQYLYLQLDEITDEAAQQLSDFSSFLSLTIVKNDIEWFSRISKYLLSPDSWASNGIIESIQFPNLANICGDYADAINRCSYIKEIYLSNAETISDEAAETLGQCETREIHLDKLAAISPGIAKGFSKHFRGVLSLDGVSSLDAPSSEGFRNFNGHLRLNGLESIDSPVADELAKMHGTLELGLIEISDEVASSFQSFKGTCLCLYQLEDLNESTASILSHIPAELELDIDALPEYAVEVLKTHPSFSKELNAEIARVFLASPESVYLHDYESISDEAAEILSTYDGELDLAGVTSISNSVAASLSKHQGEYLSIGLESLSDAAAESLSKHIGELHLRPAMGGFLSLSDSMIESLSKNTGTLSLSLNSLSETAANYLGERTGLLFLNLDGPETISDSIAESLSLSNGALDFQNLTSLSDNAAASLSKYRGDLELGNLPKLSDTAAESLSKHAGTSSKGGPSELNLYGLQYLSDAAAESLCGRKGPFRYMDLDELPESAAAILRKHPSFADDDEEISDGVLSQVVAEQFIASEEFSDLSDYVQVDDEAAELFEEYLPVDLGHLAGVERLRAGSVLGVLGVYRESKGDNDKALHFYEKSVELHADVATGFWRDLANLKSELGDDALSKAFELYNDSFEATTFSKFCKLLKKAIKECPSFPWAYNNLAWRLATSIVDAERDGNTAVKLAAKACELCDDPCMTGTLAAAYAEAGDFEQAIKLQQKVVELSPPSDIDEETENLEKYKMQEALRND